MLRTFVMFVQVVKNISARVEAVIVVVVGCLEKNTCNVSKNFSVSRLNISCQCNSKLLVIDH